MVKVDISRCVSQYFFLFVLTLTNNVFKKSYNSKIKKNKRI